MSSKQQLLTFLEANRDKYLSGEDMAKELGLSRSAVWKAIINLRGDGYKISAFPGKGYMLEEDNDILSLEGMSLFLDKKIDKNLIHVYSTLDSTNQTAKEMAVSGAENGTLIIADKQTNGRGRRKRSFISPSGGIYMSFVLNSERFATIDHGVMITYAVNAVCEAIETVTGKHPQVKWMNDIFLDGKKICGILTESASDFETGEIQWIVLGIGINFSISAKDFPKEIEAIAASIYKEGEEISATRNELAAAIINKILSEKAFFDKRDILQKYRERLNMLGKRISIVSREGEIYAKAIDIDEEGCLIAECEDGSTRHFSDGEISVRV